MSSPSPSSPIHHIVRLDETYVPTPTFSFPHTLTTHASTPPPLISSRIASASILLTTRDRITAAHLSHAPKLKLIAVMAAGTDGIDLPACRERGIRVCNVQGASNESVAEHALALYFAVRRRTVLLDGIVKEGNWGKEGRIGVLGEEIWSEGAPRGINMETVGIVGYGALGQRLHKLCSALGMTVLISDRKSSTSPKPGRTPFPALLQHSTVIILACPLTSSTRNLISTNELAQMQRDAILINVARGGVVDEEALAKSLLERQIAGAGVDVFGTEPASRDTSALLRLGREGEDGVPVNLVVSPHSAWFAKSSMEMLQQVTKGNVEKWVEGTLDQWVV